ncbi:MAG: hypothetical protein K9M54_01270 [Kiritimatiellales bacterium]|nr:hypothetical protein [Kiritimatiellales bacterium]
MLSFSIAPILDGLIHLVAFFLECFAFYLLLRVISRNRFEHGVWRTIAVVALLALARIYCLPAMLGHLPAMDGKAGWALPGAVLAVLLFPAIRLLLKTGWLATAIAAVAIVPLVLATNHYARVFSADMMPDGPTFAEYTGLANKTIAEAQAKDLKASNVDVATIVRAGLDAVASLTEKQELDAMKTDFARGMELFAERKAWMDSLTPEERQAYREEMSAFMAEQGLAEDRYALSAIQQVNPTNLVLLVSMFAELQADNPRREENIRSIPESLASIAGNLTGFTPSDADMAMLRSITALLSSDEGAAAIARARADLQAIAGENGLAGATLAALLQVESGLPVKLLLGDGPVDEPVLPEASPVSTNVVPSIVAPAQTEELQVVEASAPAPQTDPFVVVPCDFGSVRIPDNLYGEGRWTAAVQELKIKGFGALGREIVILCEDGTMIRNKDAWSVDYAGNTYRFRVDHVEKNKVMLIAEGLDPIKP